MSEEKFIYMVEKLERLKDGYDLNHTNGDYAYGILREWLEEDMYENIKKDKRSSVTHEELREVIKEHREKYEPLRRGTLGLGTVKQDMDDYREQIKNNLLDSIEEELGLK